MPFAYNYLARVSTSGNVDPGKAWIYNGTSSGSNESIATISASGYFNPAQTTLSYSFATGQTGTTGSLAVNDVIQINATDATGLYVITSVTTNVTMVAQSVPGDIQGGISLGGTYPIYAGISGSNLEFNGISLGATLTGSVSAGALTISTTGLVSFTWNSAASATQAMVANNGYYANDGGTLVAFTLPATAAAGTVMKIAGFASGGWSLAQNALQNIRLGSSVTTTGTGGSLASTAQGDCIDLVCTVANTSWIVTSSVGNLTIV